MAASISTGPAHGPSYGEAPVMGLVRLLNIHNSNPREGHFTRLPGISWRLLDRRLFFSLVPACLSCLIVFRGWRFADVKPTGSPVRTIVQRSGGLWVPRLVGSWWEMPECTAAEWMSGLSCKVKERSLLTVPREGCEPFYQTMRQNKICICYHQFNQCQHWAVFTNFEFWATRLHLHWFVYTRCWNFLIFFFG